MLDFSLTSLLPIPKYLTRAAMRKRGEDGMEPFAMDFDENKEMTDDEDFSIDMTPEYMFQKFELVLFLLADRTADLIGSQSRLRLQDKLNISDASSIPYSTRVRCSGWE